MTTTKVSFFWGRTWGLRGVAFHRGRSTYNVHYKSLVFGTGVNWSIRWTWFKRSWTRLLSLSYLEAR